MIQIPLPDPSRFAAVVERMIQLVGENVPRDKLREVAEAFRVVCWEFPDWGAQSYFLLSEAGEVDSASEWSGAVDGTITMNAGTFHDVAFGKASLGMAVLMGKVRIKGISAAKLGKFMPLLEPFMESYRLACEDIRDPA